jgi:hypothetical protein
MNRPESTINPWQQRACPLTKGCVRDAVTMAANSRRLVLRFRHAAKVDSTSADRIGGDRPSRPPSIHAVRHVTPDELRNSPRHQRWYGIADLPESITHVAREPKRVRKALQTSCFTYRDRARL